MTYSVIARCPDTGRLRLGVQSHYLATASITSWVRSGVGAIATQAAGNMMYGAKGLNLLASGSTPAEVLEKLLSEDENRETRQVAILGIDGQVAAHTGNRCISFAGHIIGDGVAFQANLMARPGVPEAMAQSWEATIGIDLEDRIMKTLRAAQEAGGDLRGQQAAGICIAEPIDSERWWEGTSINLRVDDHPNPLDELGRLLNLRKAYIHAENGEAALLNGGIEAGIAFFEQARSLAPDSIEIIFWNGVLLANDGRIQEASEQFDVVFKSGEQWKELLLRLPDAGLLNVNENQLEILCNI